MQPEDALGMDIIFENVLIYFDELQEKYTVL
jgi:hypothetical protein